VTPATPHARWPADIATAWNGPRRAAPPGRPLPLTGPPDPRAGRGAPWATLGARALFPPAAFATPEDGGGPGVVPPGMSPSGRTREREPVA